MRGWVKRIFTISNMVKRVNGGWGNLGTYKMRILVSFPFAWPICRKIFGLVDI